MSEMVMIIMLCVVLLPLLISIGIMRFIKIIVIGVPVSIAVLIGFVVIYSWLFPSLEMQFFSAVEKACKNQEDCKLHLYEIMPFKWDKAYFFLEENGYSNQDIQKITGIKKDFDLGRRDVLVLFKYHNHLVKYDIFQVYDHSDLKFSFSLWGGVNKTFAIGFRMRKSALSKLHYSGDINQFNDPVYIKYYEITPKNDLLYAGCDLDNYFQGTIKTCMFNFTNLDQVYLEKPSK